MQDRFTKWMELAALKKADSRAMIRQVKEKIFLRHGCPNTLVSDNGRQFVSREFEEFLKENGANHRKTPPYSPQCNPVERTNRVVKTMIAQYVGKHQKKWDKNLRELEFAYNTASSTATGYTPAYLNTGREFRTQGSLHQKVGSQHTTPLSSRIQHIKDAIELAKAQVARQFEKQQKHYNLRRREWKPNIGDKVVRKLVTLSSKDDARTAKLAPKYSKTLTVKRHVSPVIFDLQDDRGRYVKHIHVKDLKPFTDAEQEL
ncbi:uncharacterized protein K02A2.6-like [Nasonia vitripennis]|uniref:Integrase catalytic domain-containing protein n=1 Tax=Nasonia vitripennis TaxID=7425 RepID=A0A7M7IX21_NASVI|nr:uncharacterized protein K02A2.6-like [Nasonia vitripennis]